MNKPELKILVIDDHALVRRGVKEVIAENFNAVEIVEKGTAQGALDAVRQEEWGIVVLDLNLPDKGGLDVLKEMKTLKPSLPVVILSYHPEEQYAVRVLKAGAAGYVTKETVTEELVEAIRKALNGAVYVSEILAERFAVNLLCSRPDSPFELLSDRELEVLRLIGEGNTSTQIAQQLFLSPKTVNTYRGRLLEKLKLKTTAQLIRYAMTHQLVE